VEVRLLRAGHYFHPPFRVGIQTSAFKSPLSLLFARIGYKNTSINARFIHSAGAANNNEEDNNSRKEEIAFRSAIL
jgi:hypothetical protein